MTNTNNTITTAHITWQQGQPVSHMFNDVYFSREGGVAETEYVFLRHNQLPQRWQHCQQFVIAETGFGSGLNFITTVHHWLDTQQNDSQLFYISIEKYPLSKPDLQQALSAWPQFAEYCDELLRYYPAAIPGFHRISLFNHRVNLLLLLGDVETMLQQLHAKVDAWYLDGFAPAKNPDMWTDRVFAEMARLSKSDATFSSFTAAGHVRRGLVAQGFKVAKAKGFANKREMIHGHMQQQTQSQSRSPWYDISAASFIAKRAAVIGGGIAGMATAQSLAKRGWQVDVLERNADIASEGSGNPAGVLLPRISIDNSAEGEFYATAYQLAVNELTSIKRQDAGFDWYPSGVVQLAISERIMHQIEQGTFDQNFVQTLNAEQVSNMCGIKLEHAGLYYPQAGWLKPDQLCKILASQSADQIHVRCNITVKHLDYVARQWRAYDAKQNVLGDYNCVVLANAAAAKQFNQTSWLPLKAVRGQISYIASNDRLKQIHCPICYEGYILPEMHQYHIVGATFKPDDTSVVIRSTEHRQNLDSLLQAIPEIADSIPEQNVISGRAALRATTEDRMPLVGPVADRQFFDHHYADLAKGRAAACYAEAKYLPGLYVNTGHGARGLTSSILSAELLAAQINNEPLPVSMRVLQALLPSRFLVRAYKKGHAIS